MNFNRYIPIAKVDEEERMVYGYASTPQLDSDGEIVSLEGLKKALPEYLQFPTLREMHQPKVAGTVKNTEIREGEGLYIGAKVVADEAWNMVKEGVYRGFSIGGDIVNKIDNVINELNLVEISLVDVPANRGAKIEVWKSGKLSKDVAVADDPEMLNELVKSLDRISFDDPIAELLRKVVKINMAEKLEKQEVAETPEVEVETPEVEDVEVAPESSEEEAPEAETEEEVTEEAEESTEETEDEESEEETEDEKEASADTTFEKIDNIATKLEKMDTPKVEKETFGKGFEKVASALEKMTSVVEGLEKRVASLEKQPAPLKSKKYVEVKREETTEKVDAPEVAKKKARLEELNKIFDEVGPSKFAKMGYSIEAGKLKDELARLKA